jgi:hypothetical protein
MALNPMYRQELQNGEYVDVQQFGEANDPVNHPNHYTSHASGIEVIQITEHMNFCLGNAVKYILRAEHKGKQVEDLEKAAWYINREIERLKNENR